jgi:Protein of unknown function (DUF3991)/Toprim-like
MSGEDAELDLFRNGVNCAALLERLPPPWALDRNGSTRRALKYRRGAGEVLIVNHDGRGWWDTQSSAKGDIFDLVQFLDPSLNFGQVRQVLRPFVGIAPSFPEALRQKNSLTPDRPVAERWRVRPRLRPNSAAWRYLADARGLPAHVLEAAGAADAVRDGAYGSAWFAHRDDSGDVTHIEIRGPDFKGSVRGGAKSLFRLPGSQQVMRLAVTEAPIDALSLAALEGMRADTLYLATGGGMGAGTEQALSRALATMSGVPGAILTSATDADAAGDRYAARHAELAAAAGIVFGRLRPTDWNELIRQVKRP